MTRKQSLHPEIKEKIAARFAKAFEVGMGLTPAEISRRLGYANQTTIQAIKRGKALPDFARLALYRDQLCDRNGGALNLHWLITGEGKPFIKAVAEVGEARKKTSVDDDIIILISSMNRKQKAALTKFLIEIA
ncbi:hypothetical protein KDX09_37215 [Burkholderia cenocepacia]|uniref:hypothetical protein n=1 Tax=Burkholderia cenocepacia TaxID=95486 RepID=UPI001BA03F98|nr:hypothetical protein [Burkholderia cenocepacia]MBR8094979.1 hypothetical protein [Burkholderia cenocepacia]